MANREPQFMELVQNNRKENCVMLDGMNGSHVDGTINVYVRDSEREVSG